MKKPNESKATTPTASPKIGEPASSTPWSIIVALIVAAGGLLWLAFKRRS
jgi:LPXTG-motif cell wall-anchored protein